jgi:hypothetical protein
VAGPEAEDGRPARCRPAGHGRAGRRPLPGRLEERQGLLRTRWGGHVRQVVRREGPAT